MSPSRSPGPNATGLLLGALMVPGALGISTVAVALPSLAGDLGLSGPQAAWVLASYLLAEAMFVTVFGRMGDVRGMRAVVLAGAAMVVAGSIPATAADSFVPLIAGRALQGAGSAGLWVAAYGVIAAHFEGLSRAKALGVVSGALGIVSGAGTLIGGLLTDAGSWRLPAVLPVLALLFVPAVARLAPAAAPGGGRRFDGVGAVLVAILACALVLVLQTPSLDLQPSLIAVVAGTAVAALGAVALRMRAAPDGFIPVRVVRSARYCCGTLAAMSLFAAYLAVLFAAPLLLLQEHGWTPTQIGLALLPAAPLGAIAARITGRIVGRHDPFRLSAWLCAISVVGILVGAIGDGAVVPTTLALSLVLIGLSGGQVSLVGAVPLAVEPDVRSVATGLYTLVFLLGGAIGTAIVAGLGDPLGVAGALGCVAVLPAAGVALALASGSRRGRPAPAPARTG